MIMNRKLDNWKKELNHLTEVTGVSDDAVCDYLDVSREHMTWWRKRIPVKRETLIGIGMAYGQDLDLINDWIVRYGDKRKLYAKDVLEDLVWIYLINASAAAFEAGRDAPVQERVNFYQLYEPCRDMIRETYVRVWNEYTEHPKDTAEVEDGLNAVKYDPMFGDLRAFVIENIDSFKTAYSKSRKMLTSYVNAILETHAAASSSGRTPVNFLRGYLDDAMINYICGDDQVFHIAETESKGVSVRIKPIPKLRKTHIALCLALGMTENELNTYFSLLGYAPLNPEVEEDRRLIQSLEKWDEAHPAVAWFKRIRIQGESYDIISDRDSLQAVSDMLMLRSDLEYEYARNGWRFPYMKG